MKWAFILLMAFANVGFANDTFTAEETSLIDGQIKTAVAKKFTPQFLKQIEKNAASKYLLFKVGDKFTANSPGRNFTGTIHNIGKITLRVGDFLINKRDYPGYYFDAIFNERMRKAYVSKYYHHARNSYRQRADKYYRKKILAKRPPEKRVTAISVKQPVKQEIQQPVLKVSENFQTAYGYWHGHKEFKNVSLQYCTRINQNSIDLGFIKNGIFRVSNTAKILKIKMISNADDVNLFRVTMDTSLGGIQNWMISYKGEFLSINYGSGVQRNFLNQTFVIRKYNYGRKILKTLDAQPPSVRPAFVQRRAPPSIQKQLAKQPPNPYILLNKLTDGTWFDKLIGGQVQITALNKAASIILFNTDGHAVTHIVTRNLVAKETEGSTIFTFDAYDPRTRVTQFWKLAVGNTGESMVLMTPHRNYYSKLRFKTAEDMKKWLKNNP